MNAQKVAVVTGGAHGIGLCIAEEFRRQGVRVYVMRSSSRSAGSVILWTLRTWFCSSVQIKPVLSPVRISVSTVV